MSYFDDASLVMIPSGYKTSKVYSVKPTDGSGDLTFSRSNDTATRVNSAGLIEKVRTNLNLYSQDFTNAAYVTAGFGSRASVVANTTANPLNGAQDADTATFTAGGTQSRLLQQFSGLSTTNKYTYSIYVKAGTKNTIRIYGDVSIIGVLAEFNLSTGSVVGTPTLCTASIVSAGSGWYRCSITFNAQGAGSADCGPVSAVGEDGTAFIYGAQLEVSDFGATPYIPTTSAAVSVGPVANVPRLDYLNSSCPRLLLEPQRTNLATYSEQFNNAAWTKVDSTITANNAVSPDGSQNADLLAEATFTSSAATLATQTPIIVVTNTAYSSTIYAKAGTGRYLYFSCYYNAANEYNAVIVDLLNGTITKSQAGSAVSNVSNNVTSAGNGWYRISLTQTSSQVVVYQQVRISDVATPTIDATFGFIVVPSSNNRNVYLYGAQLEQGSYSSSYIPTLGAAVTRGADAASKTSASALIGQTEGTLYAEFDVTLGVDGGEYFLSDGTNVIAIQFPPSSPNTIRALIYNGGGFPVLMDYTYSTAGSHKVAYAYKANDFVLYVDGVQRASDTSGTVPACSIVQFGGAQNVASALVFKTRLSNSDLAALTA